MMQLKKLDAGILDLCAGGKAVLSFKMKAMSPEGHPQEARSRLIFWLSALTHSRRYQEEHDTIGPFL
jgi:hypothetical protein